MALTRRLALSFPNAVPAGTRVPQWALLDVTVRSHVINYPTLIVLTAHLSSRTTGTSTSRWPSAVGIHLSVFLSTFHPHLRSSDTPEIAPGAQISGPSSTSSTPTHPLGLPPISPT